MNKSTALMCVACFLSFKSQAQEYVGLNLGANTVSVKKELLYPLGNPLLSSASYTNAYTNFHGQVLAGYELNLSKTIGMSLEGNFEVFTGKAEQYVDNWFLTTSAYAQEHLEYGAGFFLLPSYRLNESTQAFVGPGIVATRFSISSGITAGNIGVTGSYHEWLAGGAVKAGVATRLSEQTQLLLSYQFNQYGNASWVNKETLSEDFLKGRYKPHANTFMIGIKAMLPNLVG